MLDLTNSLLKAYAHRDEWSVNLARQICAEFESLLDGVHVEDDWDSGESWCLVRLKTKSSVIALIYGESPLVIAETSYAAALYGLFATRRITAEFVVLDELETARFSLDLREIASRIPGFPWSPLIDSADFDIGGLWYSTNA